MELIATLVALMPAAQRDLEPRSKPCLGWPFLKEKSFRLDRHFHCTLIKNQRIWKMKRALFNKKAFYRGTPIYHVGRCVRIIQLNEKTEKKTDRAWREVYHPTLLGNYD